MAGNRFTVNSDAVATSTTPKSVLQVKAASNVPLLLTKIAVTGNAAAGGTDSPATVRLTRSTASFGTFTSATPAKDDPARAETLQLTAGYNATVEPTSPTYTSKKRYCPPAGSVIWVLDPPVIVPGGNAINVEITAAAGTPSFITEVEGEE